MFIWMIFYEVYFMLFWWFRLILLVVIVDNFLMMFCNVWFCLIVVVVVGDMNYYFLEYEVEVLVLDIMIIGGIEVEEDVGWWGVRCLIIDFGIEVVVIMIILRVVVIIRKVMFVIVCCMRWVEMS